MHWKQIDRHRYAEMVDILPPAILTSRGFLVGEAWRHNTEGQPMFAPFLHVDGRYFEGDEPLTIAEFNALDVRKAVAA